MADLILVAMTTRDLEAFVGEEVADYARDRVLDGTWSRRDAPERARAELAPVIAWEREAVTDERQRLWVAMNAQGERVGWAWVKLGPPGPWSTIAFLCQMTVTRAFRHRGYGRSVLAALEALLTGEGITELRLNVRESNLPAKCLYAAAGYELAKQYPRMRQLRKPLKKDESQAVAGPEEASDVHAFV